MPKIYLIAGCNGAGKTTASFTMLPKILDCKEFINVDNIASGISPFQPESVPIEAGRIMLQRIDQLTHNKVDFAIETTLSGKTYLSKITDWKKKGYEITLIYLWLNNPNLAIERIRDRVIKGGHGVPKETVVRRYYRGINNFFEHFITVCDYWIVIDNSVEKPEIIAEGIKEIELVVYNKQIWEKIKDAHVKK